MTNQSPFPLGFQAAGTHCGIKAESKKSDLALFTSDKPAVAVGVFTQNRVVGAPVKLDRERVPSNSVRAVVINSGNANACTGERGMDDARWMTALVAQQLGCAAEDVLVCSTGVIGHFLPREPLASGIPDVVEKLSSEPASFDQAAEAMLTTDTFSKLSVVERDIGGEVVRIGGVAKGAAMIGPNMATMLAVIMTDAALTTDLADAMLRHAVDRSFNCISVEGHTSTSDTVFLISSGASKAAAIEPSSAEYQELQAAVDEVAANLARQIVDDAEGCDHTMTIDVSGTRTRDEAFQIAKTVADGALVKTAITGADPNWGRIISAAGYSGVDLEEENLSLKINDVLIYEQGTPVEYDEESLSQSMRDNRDVSIEIMLDLGEAEVRFWTCDLTTEYVRLNSEYTT